MIKRNLNKNLVLLSLLLNLIVVIAPNQGFLTTLSDEVIVFEKFELNVDIHETLAEVNISGFFYNPSGELVLDDFNIEIPTGAYVDNITLQQGNATYWGRVMELQEAQEAFINATEANRSATLLTQIGQHKFKVDYSIKANSRIRISLIYFKRIVRFKGHYDLSFNVEPILEQNPQVIDANYTIYSPIRSIVNVIGPSGSSIIYHSPHQVSVKIADLSISEGIIPLSYDLTGSSLGGNILAYYNGTREFFISTFSPSLSELGTEGLPKDFVFIIDVSGSMSGDKIDQAKSALAYIIEQLHVDDRFAIVSFSDQISTASQSLIDRSDSETVDYIKGWVAALSAGGSTDIHGALLAGLEYFKESERPSILVLLTDGKPTSGITDPLTIEEKFRGANIAGVSLFTLGFGNEVNFQFLGRLARQNSGDAFKIEVDVDAAEQITDFYESVSTPILKDVKLTVNSGVVNNLVYPYFIPNLFDGSEVFLVGERESGETIDLTITGESSAGEEEYQMILSNPSSNEIKDSWVENIWAIAKIDDLINRIEYGDTSNDTKDLVLSMALYYGIVTPYTAIFIDTLDIEDSTEEYDKQMTAVAYTNTDGNQDFGRVYGEKAASSTPFDLISLVGAVLVLFLIQKIGIRRQLRK